jgi:hypothetical protein
MNCFLLPTVLIASALFAVGFAAGRRVNGMTFGLLCAFGFLIAVPGILFAVYYLKFLGEPVWLYQFRSLPGSELVASGAGFIAGLLHGKFSAGKGFKKVAGYWFFPGLLAIGLLLPYLKPMVRPPDWDLFRDVWSGPVCLQTSESSCGPACAATILRQLGKNATEKELAAAAFTSRNGTENWYLARALRVRGVQVQFVFQPELNKPWPFPAIAGVRLPESGNTGHFITVLDRVGDKYVIGDPITGKTVQTQSELRGSYDFTGFFMVIKER